MKTHAEMLHEAYRSVWIWEELEEKEKHDEEAAATRLRERLQDGFVRGPDSWEG